MYTIRRAITNKTGLISSAAGVAALIAAMAWGGAAAAGIAGHAARADASMASTPPQPVGRTDWPTGLPAESLPTSVPDGACGPWSASGSRETSAILATHGRLTSCFRVVNTWIVTTEHSSGPGEVGSLRCPTDDSECLDGWTSHDLTKFSWITAPAGHMLRLISETNGSLTFSDGFGLLHYSSSKQGFVS